MLNTFWSVRSGRRKAAARGDLVASDTPGGEFIIVVYEQIDDETIYPVTAYEVPEP
jgi:hypothetical protein